MVRLWWLRMFLHGNGAIASVCVHAPKGSRSEMHSAILGIGRVKTTLGTCCVKSTCLESTCSSLNTEWIVKLYDLDVPLVQIPFLPSRYDSGSTVRDRATIPGSYCQRCLLLEPGTTVSWLCLGKGRTFSGWETYTSLAWSYIKASF